MGHHVTTEELAERAAKMVRLLPEFRLSFPLLSWAKPYSDGDMARLVKLLRDQGLDAHRVEGGYYDSYAEGDGDLMLQVQIDATPGRPLLDGNVTVYFKPPDKPPRVNVHRRTFRTQDNRSAYDLKTECTVLDVLYPDGFTLIETTSQTTTRTRTVARPA